MANKLKEGHSRAARGPGRPRSADRPPGMTRTLLLESAADIFAKQGYEGTSIQAVATRAGVTSATIYRHFENKADLLLQVLASAVDAMPILEYLASPGTVGPRSFSRLAATYVRPDQLRLRRLSVEMHSAATREPEALQLLGRFNQQCRDGIASKLSELVDAGTLSADLDVPRTTSLIFVILMGLAHVDSLEPELIDDGGWTDFLEESFARLLLLRTTSN